ncbi:MAG TPA: hypothetical protein VMD30_12020 [Tepidisphaeraceae bacterium]|nr:hypothetical protein [Tepidisphaeraceae bacterium]
MDDAVLLAIVGLIPFLFGIFIYLTVDAVFLSAKLRWHVFPRPSPRAVSICAIIALFYFIAAVIFIELYEHYEYRERQTVLTFVNAVTGAPVQLDLSYAPFYYAQTGDAPGWKFNVVSLTTNSVRCEWNCATEIDVDQKGFDTLTIILNDDQKPTLIRLWPTGSKPPAIVPGKPETFKGVGSL